MGIFARAYVFGLDGVEGCARELCRLADVPDDSRPMLATLIDRLNPVRQVRDSLQHIEERVQGRPYGHRIPASMVFLGNYSKDAFVMTTADGIAVTLEVSEAMLAPVRSQISALDRSLAWRRAGPTCPRCGGSISPHIQGLDDTAGPSPPTIEWRCGRCGFHQRAGT